MDKAGSEQSIIALEGWLQTPAGVYMRAWEQTCLDNLTVDIFGYNAVQIGLPQIDALAANRMPNKWLVESKALKLYLSSFRNHGAFHEDCTVGIGKRLVKEIQPRWLRIGGYWYPRGGIPIDVFWQSGAAPEGLWVPDQGVANYRGRG